MPLPPGLREQMEVVPEITLALLRQRLRELQDRVGPEDALLFYYSGHGHRSGPKGYVVPGRGRPDRPDSLLDLAELVKALRDCNAHHTLMLLDCCFSGVALEPESGVAAAVGKEKDRRIAVVGGDNLGRVFRRRAFQVITAGAGSEVVGNVVQLSREYAELARKAPEFRGHSPFTSVLLQALRGLTGRADGKLLASALGHHMNDTLVNDERIGARQARRYGALGGGEGDFLFIPSYTVLNPRLIAPLYLSGPQYADLRQSACLALQRFIADRRHPKETRLGLARSAVVHLGKLLSDEQPGPRLSAVRRWPTWPGITRRTPPSSGR